MIRFYVYVSKTDLRNTFYFDNLSEAIKKYCSISMEALKDCVFLGYENMEKNMCFDFVHKFFKENVLINDYLNHAEDETVMNIFSQIVQELPIRYQFTSHILRGVLIDFSTGFTPMYVGRYTLAPYFKFKELYLSRVKDEGTELEVMGWVEHYRETYEKYSWNYPKVASYVKSINVPVYDINGNFHQVDMDARDYLALLGEKYS